MVASVQAVRAVGVRSRVGELLEAWFAIASTGWAPTTIRQTRSVLDRYLRPRLGRIPVGDVTAAIIDATYAVVSRRGGVGGRPLAPGTLARVHVVLRAAFAQAVRWGWVWDNPVERAHRVVTVTRELRPPTPQELRALLEHVAARDPQFTPCWCSPRSPEPAVPSCSASAGTIRTRRAPSSTQRTRCVITGIWRWAVSRRDADGGAYRCVVRRTDGSGGMTRSTSEPSAGHRDLVDRCSFGIVGSGLAPSIGRVIRARILAADRTEAMSPARCV
jgi:hypothetical protein